MIAIKIPEQFKNLLVIRVVIVILLFFVIAIGLIFQDSISSFLRKNNKSLKSETDVSVPTIINGNLILPKIISTTDNSQKSGGLQMMGRLGVISANLIGVYDEKQKQLTGIRVIGEAANLGSQIVNGFSAVVRFYDAENRVVGQKVGRLSNGYDYFGIMPNDKSYYDVTVDNPPTSEKLEIVLNTTSSTPSALFEPLKIASRALEKKLATINQPTPEASSSSEATPSATPTPAPEEKVEYYTVSGSVMNLKTSPISDITIYAWAKGNDNKVFTFGRQDFKNDLLLPGDKIDFKINLLPFKGDVTLESYEIAAWGKEYKLGY